MGHRIGILTGGGDVPGLNSVIKEVVYRGTENRCEIVGIRRGWEGLTHVNPDDPASQEALHYAAGSRQHPHHRPDRRHDAALQPHQPGEDEGAAAVLWPPENFTKKNGRWDISAHVLKNIEWLKLDYLIAIGGDDTLSYASRSTSAA